MKMHLRVTDMPPGEQTRQGLQVTLENDMVSGNWVWVNGRMAQSPGDGGEIEIIAIGDDEQQIGDECRRRSAPPEAWHYMVLAPGESVTRVLGLQCYDLLGKHKVTFRAVYQDKNPASPEPPLPQLPMFKERLSSNTVVIEWP